MDPAKNDEARRKLTDKGASLVSSLKLRVSRLEATLREKEAELAKLQASSKVTALNEMKIQAETYYQEVVRLRNKLNVAQQQQQRVVVHNAQLPNSKAPRDLREGVKLNNIGGLGMLGYIEGNGGAVDMSGRQRAGGDGQESPTASMRHTIVRLEEENSRLSHQLTTSNTEKERLSTDLERVLGLSEDAKANYESISRLELIRELEHRQAEVGRLEAQQTQLTEVLSHRNDHSGDSNSILQARMAELQSRELEWERERSSLRELINTLKDDRIFYKETAQKKDSDLDALRGEVSSLQQEVISLHETEKKRLDRQRHTPSPMQQRASRGGYGSSRSGGSSSEPNTPTRRPRPSSARPPAARPARTTKASSEPRDVNERQKKSIDNKRPSGSTRPPSRPPSSASTSPTKIPSQSRSSPMTSSMTGSITGRPGSASSGVRRSSSSSVSSPTKGRQASPYGSPRKPSAGNTSRSVPPSSRSAPSSPTKVPTPLTSPRKTSVPQSPARSVTPRSSMSSKSNSPYSSVNSSPAKTVSNRNNITQSPTKSRVPLTKSVGSPIKTSASAGSRIDPKRSSRRKEENISSPSATQKSSRHRSTTKESSQEQSSSASPIHQVSSQKSSISDKDSEAPPAQNTAISETNSVCLSNNDSMENESSLSVHETEEKSLQKSIIEKSSSNDGEEKAQSMETIKEDSFESERVLAELIFQNDTDSTTDSINQPGLERQRTITLSVHGSLEASEIANDEGSAEASSLLRQNTVTLSRSEHSSIEAHSTDNEHDLEGVASNIPAEADSEASVIEKELVDKDEKDEDESLKNSFSEITESKAADSNDQEIIDNLELLRSLLSSHLSRHHQVNELLSEEPMLMGEVQTSKSSSDRSRSRERPSPDGQEATRSSARSQSLVRQGTFNVIDEEDEDKSIHSTSSNAEPTKSQPSDTSSQYNRSTTVAHVHSTLDGHLTRVNKLNNRQQNTFWDD